ncbi:hypothetical protein LSH36_51g04005 [Paralvinella palmiformis]|uniref:Aminopeptidase n=1 Tax=Paralvinella palmiformis TaxID=53620 RepID=A0AAD9K6L0_9ANNE|nr:hypothetical protein LSH36_51g04005 [Paralvinella palmiformis]
MTFLSRTLILVSVTVRNSFQISSSPKAGCIRAPPYWISFQKAPVLFQCRARVFSTNTYSEMPEKKPFERLPKDVVPVNYAIRLQPYLEKFTFDGVEDISIQIKKPVKSIILNCADIHVKSVKYDGGKQAFGEDIKITYLKEDETVSFTFPDELQTGDGTLKLTFSGELNDKMKGFYRSKYTSPDGKERYGAVTQFEATDARRAFPCWDEPSVKATFDVTLVVPKDKVALSNMPEKSVAAHTDPSWKVVQYEHSPTMSTYLVAFVVGEYDFVEAKDSDGVQVRVYTPAGKSEQGKFALEVAVKTLPFYKDYFNIAYPLPKIDLIAIADFAAGAMENWGLVTYRETAVLVDPVNSSSAARQYVALVVGHELAHQWFGNLVTMEWWTHLWLNEGFASWIEYLCVDNCFPEYDIWTQFASSDFTRALELDALKNSHPIEVPVGHPSEIDEIFDAISYSKGASVIRMLHDYIGDKDFKKGMNAYLSKHKYTNTFTEDLWEALGDASGKPVQRIMSTWTKQMGFPVLTVTQKVEGQKRILTIKQKKFCADGSAQGTESLWEVPIGICTASSPQKSVHRFVLNEKEATVTIDNIKPNDWIKINTGAVGFYRTQYSTDMLEALIPGIKDQTLPPRDRLGLQNDMFALARAGTVPLVQVLRLAEAFQNETNYTVWNDLSMNLGTPLLLSQYTDYYDAAKAFICKLFGPIGKKLGWDAKDGEPHLDAMLRSLVIGRLGKAGHKATVEEAKRRFAAHCDGSSTLPADLRNPVYGTVLKQGGEEEFGQMLKLLKTADLHEEKVRILRSLGTVQQESLIQKTLDFAMSDEVRSQDTVFVIAGVTGSKLGREMAWKFVKDNWKSLHERYRGGFLLARLVKTTTENFVSEERAKDIEEFFGEHEAPSAERTIQQSLENISLNRNQLKRDGPAMKEFFSAYHS